MKSVSLFLPPIVFCFSLCIATIVSFAQAGVLDPSFGNGGKVVTSIGNGVDQGYAIAVQNDGKIVVAGSTYNGSNSDIVVARYQSNGVLDSTFDLDGKVISTLGMGEDEAKALLIQPDGKIVVAGRSDFKIGLIRYHSNGSPDSSFDNDGKIITAVGTVIDVANAIALQADGKIIVLGSSLDNATGHNFALVRYNTNGSLDSTFDFDGKLSSNIGVDHDYGNALALQADGKILAAGRIYIGGGVSSLALVRYHSNGSLDSTFNSYGIVSTIIGNASDEATSIAVQADGKIVVAGRTYYQSKQRIALVRYNSNGSVDYTFGNNGIIINLIGTGTYGAEAMVPLPDGKFVVTSMGYTSNLDFGLARYNSNGSLDSSFDYDGVLTTDFNNLDDWPNDIALQADGKIVVAGWSVSGTDTNIAVCRYFNTPTGVNEVHNSNRILTIYPNPFSNSVNISSNISIKNATLLVCNLYGQVIKKMNGITRNAGESFILTKENLCNGVYFLRLMEDNVNLEQCYQVVLID